MGVFTTKINPDSKKTMEKFEKTNRHFPLKKLKNGFEKTCQAWCATRACSSPETLMIWGVCLGPFLIKMYRCFFNKPKVGVQKLFTLFHCHTFFVFFCSHRRPFAQKIHPKNGIRCWGKVLDPQIEQCQLLTLHTFHFLETKRLSGCLREVFFK